MTIHQKLFYVFFCLYYRATLSNMALKWVSFAIFPILTSITHIFFLSFWVFHLGVSIYKILKLVTMHGKTAINGKDKSEVLPLSHIDPVHPVSHPPSHRPVTWLQVVPSLQCPTQCLVQLTSYHPSLHSVKEKDEYSHLKNVVMWLKKCLNSMEKKNKT